MPRNGVLDVCELEMALRHDRSGYAKKPLTQGGGWVHTPNVKNSFVGEETRAEKLFAALKEELLEGQRNLRQAGLLPKDKLELIDTYISKKFGSWADPKTRGLLMDVRLKRPAKEFKVNVVQDKQKQLRFIVKKPTTKAYSSVYELFKGCGCKSSNMVHWDRCFFRGVSLRAHRYRDFAAKLDDFTRVDTVDWVVNENLFKDPQKRKARGEFERKKLKHFARINPMVAPMRNLPVPASKTNYPVKHMKPKNKGRWDESFDRFSRQTNSGSESSGRPSTADKRRALTQARSLSLPSPPSILSSSSPLPSLRRNRTLRTCCSGQRGKN
jgi:hypothetical protein